MWSNNTTTINTRSAASNYLSFFSILLISLTTIFGNLAVIVVACLDANLRVHVSNYLIFNLAITDFLTGMLVMVPSAIAVLEDSWIMGSPLCHLHCGLNHCFIIVSITTLAMISTDRAVAVRRPLHYPVLMTTRRICVMNIYTWSKGLIFASIPISYGWVQYDYWEAVCSIVWQLEHGVLTYVILTFVLCFVLPGSVILYCNYLIILSASQKMGGGFSQSSSVSSTADHELMPRTSKGYVDYQNNRKVVHSIVIITSVFFICMTPFCITKVCRTFFGNESVPAWANLFSTIVQFISSATNPFIYGIFRKDFKDAFRRIPRKLMRLHDRPACSLLMNDMNIYLMRTSAS